MRPSRPTFSLHHIRSTQLWIYKILIGFVSVIIAITPFLFINISINAYGEIQQKAPSFQLVFPTAGKIISIDLTENQKIKKGQLLASLDQTAIVRQQNILQQKIDSTSSYLRNTRKMLDALAGADTLVYSTPVLDAPICAATWERFALQHQQGIANMRQMKSVFLSSQTLFYTQAISRAEYELHSYEYLKAARDVQLIIFSFKKQLLLDRNQLESDLNDLRMQYLTCEEHRRSLSVKSPLSGTLHNFIGLSSGSVVSAHLRFGEIIPKSTFTAICYIRSSDVGLIHSGQLVRLSIDAFQPGIWGTLHAKVSDISADVIIRNNTPYFKVHCEPLRIYLQRKDGQKGYIRKGMAFQARVQIARRSVFYLFSTRVNEWFNN